MLCLWKHYTHCAFTICMHDTIATICMHDTISTICIHDTIATVCIHDTILLSVCMILYLLSVLSKHLSNIVLSICKRSLQYF